MKSKKILIVGFLLATACGIAYCSTEATNVAESGVKVSGIKVDNTSNIDFSHFKWLQKYPQLANIESNNQTAMIDKLRTSESISQLIGPINNPYGVRDDILYEIVQLVPESQPQLLRASIQEAYYGNLGYYSASNDDKLKYTRMASLTLTCSYIMLHEFNNQNIAENIIYMLSDKYRNTPQRKAYVQNIEQTVFAWQTLGYGEGDEQRCKKGDY